MSRALQNRRSALSQSLPQFHLAGKRAKYLIWRPKRTWRNWKTQGTSPMATSCGFYCHRPQQAKSGFLTIRTKGAIRLRGRVRNMSAARPAHVRS